MPISEPKYKCYTINVAERQNNLERYLKVRYLMIKNFPKLQKGEGLALNGEQPKSTLNVNLDIRVWGWPGAVSVCAVQIAKIAIHAIDKFSSK